jgi:hypothetical protein
VNQGFQQRQTISPIELSADESKTNAIQKGGSRANCSRVAWPGNNAGRACWERFRVRFCLRCHNEPSGTAVVQYSRSDNGSLEVISTVASTQAATCWITMTAATLVFLSYIMRTELWQFLFRHHGCRAESSRLASCAGMKSESAPFQISSSC